MKNILSYLCILILAITTKSSANFQHTKKQAKKLWEEHPYSFYCGCQYDEHLFVDHKSCGYEPVNLQRAQRIEWEHLVPVSWFGRHRPCWHYAKKKGLNPRSYCEKKDPIFKKMFHDLHNLVPAIGEVNQARGAYGFGTLNSPSLFNGCEITIDTQARKVDPKDSLKGTIARAHLYMEQQYGKQQFILSPQQHQQYEKWNKLYPPLEWEKIWNRRIKKLQGTNNNFIVPAQT